MSRPRRALAASVVAIVLAVAPIFMVGAVAVLMRAEIDLSQSRLGLCAAVFYGASALAAVSGGRFADRVGGLRAMRVGVLGSALTLLSLALFARHWLHVMAFLLLGGLANGITQPSTNLAVARWMPASSQGLAFGIKQTDGSFATLVAGLAASLIAVPFGWRWAVAAVSLGAVGFFVVRPSEPDSEPRKPVSRAATAAIAKRPLILMALGAGFATGGGVSMGGFYVDAIVAGGLSVRTAGWLLAGGSIAAAAGRIGWGWLVDRRGGSPYLLASLLLVIGSGGFFVLATDPGMGWLLPATGVAFGAGWAWPGLLLYGVVRENLSSPGEATGIVLAGSSCGGVAGPLIFGWLAEHAGYPTAWRAGGIALLLASTSVFVAYSTRRRAHNVDPSPTAEALR